MRFATRRTLHLPQLLLNPTTATTTTSQNRLFILQNHLKYTPNNNTTTIRRSVFTSSSSSQMTSSTYNTNNNNIKVHIFPILSDNYSYLIVDSKTKVCALVDPAEPKSVIPQFNELNKRDYQNSLQLRYILTTHHHWDHSGGNVEMKQEFPHVEIIGSQYEDIPARTRQVHHDEQFQLNDSSVNVRVLYTPCHTRGHVQYLISPSESTSNPYYYLFSGDTFFVAGAGKFFEGDAKQMTENVQLIKTLDLKNTLMYPGHEYTVSNLKFALTVEPDNPDLKEKMNQCQQLRNSGEPTVPSTLEDEFKYNPFFRVFEPNVQKWANAVGDAVKTMKVVRETKDHFRA